MEPGILLGINQFQTVRLPGFVEYLGETVCRHKQIAEIEADFLVAWCMGFH